MKKKVIRPAIWNEMDKHNPREVYKLSLLDMFRFWDTLSAMQKYECLEVGLDKIIRGKYKGKKCLHYKALPVILK